MPPRLYLDNAATSSPKPPGVIEAMVDYATRLGGSPGRGAYYEAREAGRLVALCRRRIATLLNTDSPDHIIFTLNTSDALNLAIRGVLQPHLDDAGPAHVVTTEFDHNSVLRPLNTLIERTRGRIAQTLVPPDPATGTVRPDDIRRAIRSRPDTRLVVINHAGNVTGAIQPAEEIARVCRDEGVLFLLDAAQSLGHIPVDMRAIGADLIAFPGHKGLLGPSGTGGLAIRHGVEHDLATLREGGTGSRSELDVQPDSLPDKYEPGSPNAIGLIGLSEGVRYLLDFTHADLRGIDAVRAHERELIALFLAELGFERTSHDAGSLSARSPALPALTLHGPTDPDQRVGVFTITIDGYDPHELAALLESEFAILARAGIHCAPLAHRALGTSDDARSLGAVRLSLGPFITDADIRRTTDALRLLAGAASPVSH